MAYWLMKTEPGDYSWDRLVADGETEWTGVRNHQAAGNCGGCGRASAASSTARSLTRRSSASWRSPGRRTRTRPTRPASSAASASARSRPSRRRCRSRPIRADPRLADLALVRQSRLSVVPVGDEHWRILCGMAGVEAS